VDGINDSLDVIIDVSTNNLFIGFSIGILNGLIIGFLIDWLLFSLSTCLLSNLLFN
jgi:tetrahydromethanopterin S-methyltransferase subunit G